MFVRRRQQRFGRGTEDEVIAEINDKQAFFLRLVRKISQDKGIAPEHGAIDAVRFQFTKARVVLAKLNQVAMQ